jgi:hypothetical protein
MCWAVPAAAQLAFLPASASTRLYFAQVADGGPAAQNWTTSILLVNPGPVPADVTLNFFRDGGDLLPFDFGSGPASVVTLNVPAGGSKTLSSSGASANITTGWGLALASTPISGTVLYRATQGGAPLWDVAAAGTGPTYQYFSAANGNLGLALANPSNQRINVTLAAKDQNGSAVGSTATVPLPPFGHTSFNLFQPPMSLPRDFSGSLTITPADSPPAPFVAWTLNVRDNLLSPLPPGETLAPQPAERRISAIFPRLAAAANLVVRALAEDPRNFTKVTPAQIASYLASMEVRADPDSTLKASFRNADRKILLSYPLLELTGASDGALAFLIAHMAVRGLVVITGQQATDLFFGITDQDAAIDTFATFMISKAGFDPGGAGDFYGRLMVAGFQQITVDSSTAAEFSLPGGVTNRLQTSSGYLTVICGAYTTIAKDCRAVHEYWHPHYPAQVP